MALDPITGLIDLGSKLIDKVLPDPQAKMNAQLELMKLAREGTLAQLNADLEAAKAQAAINQVEASAPDLFTRGWRPAVGWTCALGLATQFLIGPIATWGAALFGKEIAFPQLDLGTLLTLLFGMLGLGAMRSVEIVQGKKPQGT
jgi:hypothetical protein